MRRERRLTKGETPEAPTKKLASIVSRPSLDTAVQLARIETILDGILGSLAGAR